VKWLATRLPFERLAEFLPTHANTIKPPIQTFKTRISLAPFDAADVVSMEVGFVAKGLLR
jgi:hypothetical protein